MAFWTYILRCADGSYYTGHTDDLDARFAAHQSGMVQGYTSKRRPVTLAWSQDFASRIEALQAERQIKGWSRAKKDALIASDWRALSQLARNRQADNSPSTSSGRTEEEKARLSSVRAEPGEGQAKPPHPSDQNP